MSDLLDTQPAEKGNARSSGYARNAADWYVESPECVEAILQVEMPDYPIWDPACGGGNIPRVCRAHQIEAIGSDLIDRGCGATIRDFFDFREPLAPTIITNPPFQLAQKFIEHAHRIGVRKMILVQRLAFLEGQARGVMFRRLGLTRVWVHSRRQSMPPGGVAVEAKNGSVAYAWFVFDWTIPAPVMWSGGFLP